MTKNVPVLIYAPGLGRYPENTADAIADVLASTMDRLDPTATYGTKTDPSVSAPRGLKVAKTIVDRTDNPVLQLFELDYLPALEPPSTATGPPVVPGLFRSASYAILGSLRWWVALKQPAKTRRSKAQLFVGFCATGTLVFAALVALYSALVAMGMSIPGAGIFGETVAKWAFGISSIGLVVTWSALRGKILAVAATTQRLIRFVRNDETAADTTSIVLDQAIDGLAENQWTGNIHLLGYSFGSLVLYEAMFPRASSLRSPTPVASVASLVTIGCPLDIVRLYEPSFTENRSERRPGLPWTNVFNAADIFASNLKDGDDNASGEGGALATASTTPVSTRYLDEELGAFQIFVSGKTHAGYWGAASRANCFEPLVATWQ